MNPAALIAARVSAGKSRREACELIGKTESHLAKIERGEVRLFADDALALARFYGVTVCHLLTGEPESRFM